MGKVSNKVCICWDLKASPLANMVVNVGARLVIILLRFGTFFGACFRCNGFGHFARSYPLAPKQPTPVEEVTTSNEKGAKNET